MLTTKNSLRNQYSVKKKIGVSLMNSTVENDKPQLKTKTRNGTRKRGNLPDSISSTAEIFNH